MAYPQYRGQTDKVHNTGYAIYGGDGTNFYPVLLDTDGHLQIDVLSGAIGHDKTGVGHGVETVDAAGTHQKISTTSVACKVVIVQAQTDNTSAIAVGATGVDATVASGTGVLLYAGDSMTLEVGNLQDVWIDALVQDEGVRFTYLT